MAETNRTVVALIAILAVVLIVSLLLCSGRYCQVNQQMVQDSGGCSIIS